jgi:hypothetical protein
MKIQDKYYLEKEGDDFFSRNFEGHDAPDLRENKKTILNCIENSKINFNSVIEFGCNYGDLLNYFSTVLEKKCVGIEASNKAVEYGRKLYSDAVEFHHGVIADNPVSNDTNKDSTFDLAIVDDVFSWVSRNSILASIANVDKSIKDGGFLFIRDFKPHTFTKTRNHHIVDSDVYNFKVVGSHLQILLNTGMYEIVSENIYYDNSMSVGYECDNPFNYRWSDVILQKKSVDYFDEVTKI